MLTRRSAFKAAAGVAAAATVGASQGALAADRVVHIGFDASLTGADATAAVRVVNGAVMAVEEANKSHAVKGITFQLDKYDDGTATAGQYDPAQAATNARKMVSDKDMLAALGPQMSGAGKAMSPILSAGDLAIITPSSTNPDITDPKFAAQYRPAGKAIYFRTVTTDAFQGPNMANFMKEKLHVQSVYVLDDTGAFGVGVADAFQAQAQKIGIKVLGRDKLDPKAADYTAILTQIKSLNPQAIYYGGVTQAGVKLAKQAYDIIPNVIKAGPDGMFSSDLLKGAGFPAVEGWYASNASPHLTEDPSLADWNKRFRERFNDSADDYTICAYDGAWVIINAVKSLVDHGKPVTRSNVRDAIQATNMKSLQGPIEFDANGDIKNRVVSVFQIKKTGDGAALEDPQQQYHYVGVAPMA